MNNVCFYVWLCWLTLDSGAVHSRTAICNDATSQYSSICTDIASASFSSADWLIQLKLNSIKFNSIKCNSIKCNSIKCNSIKCNSVKFNSIKLNSITFNFIKFNSIKFNSIKFNSIKFNSTKFYLNLNSNYNWNLIQIILPQPTTAMSLNEKFTVICIKWNLKV